MRDIDVARLRRLDVSVLLVFLGLMRHRKATVVAEELGLTQSAISHALRRLRDIAGDELFLRRPHGLDPTAFAVALEPPIREAVASLERAFSEPDQFDPGTIDRVVTIGALDAELAVMVPRLLSAVEAEAPKLRVSSRSLGHRSALDALVEGTIDLAIGFFPDLGDDFVASDLYEESYLVVCSAGGDAAEGGMSLETYLSRRHVLVSPRGDLRGVVDDVLARDGLTREIVAAVPSFFPALASVAASNCIATVPRRLAVANAARFGLKVVEPPLPIRSFSISAVRHRRDARNGLTEWLVAAVGAACRLDRVDERM